MVALLSVCGLSSFFIVADERQGRDAIASGAAPPAAVPRDIGSREADPKPLSAAEVFPGEELAIDPTQPAYRVLRTSAGKDCRRAAAGRVAGLLRELGCTQVVRGTLRSSDGQYLVTAGVFNLSDVEGAEWAREKIKPMVEAGQGRFHGLLAGRGTEAIALSSAQVGWHVRGHYLVYCVVARTDRKPIADGDQRVGQILTDLLETHLRGTVIEKRATAPVSGS